ncbi:MAG: tetratricopeptide repeat protein [Phycisphaerae bacterium]|nr:tetratricopeptide repeat protein [Phycisphaerae bacterium]
MRHKTRIILVNGLATAARRASRHAGAIGAASLLALLSGCDRSAPTTPPPPPAPVAAPLSPADIDALRTTADKALDDGRVDDALRVATYLAERTDDATAHELVGRVHLARAGRDASRGLSGSASRGLAADAYARAAARAPSSAPLQHAAAMVLDASGRSAEARPLYDRAVELEPRTAEFRLHRANARIRANDLEGAALDAAALREIEPKDPWCDALDAEIALARGDATGAVDRARRAVDGKNDEIAFRVLLSRALRAAGRAEEAVIGLRGLTQDERASPAVAREIALGYAALGRPKDAADAWETSVVANPGDVALRVAVVEAWLAAGDRLRAREALDALLRLAPEHEARARLERSISEASGRRPDVAPRP